MKKRSILIWVLLALILLGGLALYFTSGRTAPLTPAETNPALVLLPEQTEAQTPAPDETGAQTQTETQTPAQEQTEAQASAPEESSLPAESAQQLPSPDENGSYNSKEEVALYIHLYGHLPDNYITKKEAEKLGWSGGSLEPYAPGKSIGGSYFGNYEGLLPEAKGRSYTECDIDTAGKSSRGAKRIVFSNDGLIFYTDDHYESFELLYGEVD